MHPPAQTSRLSSRTHWTPKLEGSRPTPHFAPPISRWWAPYCTALLKPDLTSLTRWECCAAPCPVPQMT
eukprot:3687218-Pleurochrysis_carterae.AAC.1